MKTTRNFIFLILLMGILNVLSYAQDSISTPAQAAQAEAIIKKDPANIGLRRNLIRYYEDRKSSADKMNLRRHRLAYIVNYPDAETAVFPYLGYWDNDDVKNPEYLELKNEWLKQISLNQSNTSIRHNAFWFFYSSEPQLAEKILKDGQQIDPNEIFYSTILIQKYIEDYQKVVNFKVITDPSEFPAKERENLNKILSEALKGISTLDKNSKADEEDKSLRRKFLSETAKAYFELDDLKNAGLAAESLIKSIGKPEEAEYFMDVNVNVALYQTAMSVLGRIQLRQGNIEKARELLLNSVNSLDRERIYSLSFDTRFLSEFLVIDGRKTVLEYLSLFKPLEKVSEDQKLEIKKWEEDMAKGRFPEFEKSLAILY